MYQLFTVYMGDSEKLGKSNFVFKFSKNHLLVQAIKTWN